MATIKHQSDRLAVDFSSYARNITETALEKLPSQFVKSCVLRQFIAVFTDQLQELYDASITVLKGRTIADAQGEQVDAIGRIVGEPRSPYQYTEDHYMHADMPNKAPDTTPVYCLYGLLAEYIPAEDPEYKMNILTRIIKNHTLTASAPELTRLMYLVTGQHISFEKAGPYTVNLIVPSGLSQTAYNILTYPYDTIRADNVFAMPYPATLNISGVFIYVPWKYLLADTPGDRAPDKAACAVGVPETPELKEKRMKLIKGKKAA